MIDRLMPFIPANAINDEIAQIIEEQRRLFYVAITRCKAGIDYPGRLIISSFLSIFGLDAVRMGIAANTSTTLRVRSTRFINDFQETSTTPILGNNLI